MGASKKWESIRQDTPEGHVFFTYWSECLDIRRQTIDISGPLRAIHTCYDITEGNHGMTINGKYVEPFYGFIASKGLGEAAEICFYDTDDSVTSIVIKQLHSNDESFKLATGLTRFYESYLTLRKPGSTSWIS